MVSTAPLCALCACGCWCGGAITAMAATCMTDERLHAKLHHQASHRCAGGVATSYTGKFDWTSKNSLCGQQMAAVQTVISLIKSFSAACAQVKARQS